MKHDLEDKKNQKGSTNSINVANGDSYDSRLMQMFFQFTQVKILS